MRILIHNQKGGVGKTTTAINLGAALARAGAGRVCLVDLDAQMHLTAAVGARRDWGTARDWMLGGRPEPQDVDGEPNLQVIAGDPAGLPGILPQVPQKPRGCDWLVCDAAPAWSRAMAQMMAGADLLLCPLEPDFLGLNGISLLLRQMEEAGLDRSALRLVLCRFSNRLALHREVRARLMERFGAQTLVPVVIRNSVRLSEAPGQGKTIFAHAPGSTGAADYASLATALMQEGRL